MNNGLKRIFEVAAAILLAMMAFHLLGFIASVLMGVLRFALSLLVFGGVVAALDWALFRRGRQITR